MRISIVLLTCNQCATTLRCLDSLGVPPPDVEIILVDNGSTDGTSDKIGHLYPHVRLIHLPANLGVSSGRNAGLSQARGNYIMLLDNDTLPTINNVNELAQYLNLHPSCALVAPRLVGTDGATQRSFRPFPGIIEKLRSALRLLPDTIPDNKIPSAPLSPFYVLGAAMLVRHEIFDRIGLFDETIFYGPDDADLCMRIRLTHLGEITYLPSVTITHLWQRASRRPFSGLWWHHVSSLLHFYRRHHRFIR